MGFNIIKKAVGAIKKKTGGSIGARLGAAVTAKRNAQKAASPIASAVKAAVRPTMASNPVAGKKILTRKI